MPIEYRSPIACAEWEEAQRGATYGVLARREIDRVLINNRKCTGKLRSAAKIESGTMDWEADRLYRIPSRRNGKAGSVVTGVPSKPSFTESGHHTHSVGVSGDTMMCRDLKGDQANNMDSGGPTGASASARYTGVSRARPECDTLVIQ